MSPASQTTPEQRAATVTGGGGQSASNATAPKKSAGDGPAQGASGTTATTPSSTSVSMSDGDGGVSDDDSNPVTVVTLRDTQALAPIVGPLARPASGQEHIGCYGTDLGRSTVHQGALRLLFGDTWASADTTAIDATFDDTQGIISLQDFPDGPSVDAYVAAHPALSGQPAWRAAGPPVTMIVHDDKVLPITPYRDGMALSMSLGRTPVAAWSDGNDGLFAIMDRIQPLMCANSEPRCPKNFDCDSGLGGPLGAQGDGIMPCIVGQTGCTAVPTGGVCQDRSSSVYDAASPVARQLAAVYTEELGNEDLTQPGRFLTTAFNTNKFINPCARTVQDFDPQRKDGRGNVYTSAIGSGPHQKLFIWGRPWFSGARGRDVRLYLMYIDLPKYDPAGHFNLDAQYFAGVSDGVPQFSPREIDAKPLDLSYPQGDPSTEVEDEPGELSVGWIQPLHKWMLLYGGEYAPESLVAMQGTGASAVQANPYGGIHVRFAEHPWGPWSAPQDILRAHTDKDEIVPITNAPKGILARPDCNDPDCAPRESGFPTTERGGFYSAHMVEPWTTDRGSEVDVYWVVSTWNPYQVVLMKTTFGVRR